MSSHLKIWMKWESQLIFLGILIKPIEVKDAKIYLEVDPVVEQVLTQKEIAYTIEEVVLDKPLRHVNLTAMNINPFANVSLQDYLEIVQIVDSTFPIGSF